MLLLSSIYAAGFGLSRMSRDKADSTLKNMLNLDFSAVYNVMDNKTKEKYKTTDEFIGNFPITDTMNPENKEVFLQKVVEKGEAQFSYFLPNQEKPEEGHRVTLVINYSLFDNAVKDVLVQEDTAPVQ